jgi:hypothetical protein
MTWSFLEDPRDRLRRKIKPVVCYHLEVRDIQARLETLLRQKAAIAHLEESGE